MILHATLHLTFPGSTVCDFGEVRLRSRSCTDASSSRVHLIGHCQAFQQGPKNLLKCANGGQAVLLHPAPARRGVLNEIRHTLTVMLQTGLFAMLVL